MSTTTQNITGYKGSSSTRELVQNTIRERYGDELAQTYKPEENCATFVRWKQLGYRVKKGEKAIRSFTVIKDEATGKRYFKTVFLFFISQVEPISSKS